MNEQTMNEQSIIAKLTKVHEDRYAKREAEKNARKLEENFERDVIHRRGELQQADYELKVTKEAKNRASE